MRPFSRFAGEGGAQRRMRASKPGKARKAVCAPKGPHPSRFARHLLPLGGRRGETPRGPCFMNDRFAPADALPIIPVANDDVVLDGRGRLALYLAVGLAAGAVIALQIDIMRVFSVGSWAHFGSLVVSLAMLGFGLTSAVMCVAKDWFQRHWLGAASVALALFGPLAVGANLFVQQLGFNAIFLVSDPAQKWKLLEIFLADLTPFLAGAVFLGCVFLKSNRTFGRVYFADLAGSGLCGLVFLGAMYLLKPDELIAAPLALWLLAGLAWSFGPGGMRTARAARRARRHRFRRPFRRRAGARLEPPRGQRLQGRRLCPQIPRRAARLRKRVAVRLYRGLFQLLPAFRAGPFRQCGVQPADRAVQRLSRHVYRQRRADRHHQGSAGEGYGLFPLSCRCTTPMSSRRIRRPSSRSSAAAFRARWRCARARAASRPPRAIARCSPPFTARSSPISPATSSQKSASSITKAGIFSPIPTSVSTSSI